MVKPAVTIKSRELSIVYIVRSNIGEFSHKLFETFAVRNVFHEEKHKRNLQLHIFRRYNHFDRIEVYSIYKLRAHAERFNYIHIHYIYVHTHYIYNIYMLYIIYIIHVQT